MPLLSVSTRFKDDDFLCNLNLYLCIWRPARPVYFWHFVYNFFIYNFLIHCVGCLQLTELSNHLQDGPMEGLKGHSPSEVCPSDDDV